MAFGDLIYSDHLMLFTDLHSLRPKTTEQVRVAEIESFASSNDNCYTYRVGTTRRLIKIAYCLSRRHEKMVDIQYTSSTCFTATDQRGRYGQPTTMTSKCHQRAASAPRLWNALPRELIPLTHYECLSVATDCNR